MNAKKPIRMYYKVLPGSSLYEALQALYIKIVDAEERSTELAEELGAESYVTSWDYVAGKPWYFYFCSGRPEYFLRWAEHRRQPGFWFPRRQHSNKTLLARIKGMPSVSNDELNAILKARGFQWYYKNGWPDIFRRPKVDWGKEVILVHFPEGVKYEPIEGMAEIERAEYEELLICIKTTWFQPCKEVVL